MSASELAMVLDWAAAEGWNPGLDDADAFHAADPDGFLLNLVGGKPAAAVSVVNHSPGVAFLGLYLCRPEFRGQGHGLAVWNAGLAHAGGRCVLLDGVPAQQANYLRSGFARLGRTVRWQGRLAPSGGPAGVPPEAAEIAHLLAADAAATGYPRPAYMTPWLHGSATRRTLVTGAPGAPSAWATGRTCREGVKVGPLQSGTEAEALALVAALSRGETVAVDVPETSPLAEALSARGFQPVFDTARMARGTPPAGRPPRYEAVATLELG